MSTDPIEEVYQKSRKKIRYDNKLTAKAFITLFCQRYQQEIGFPYHIQNWQSTGQYVKTKIIDFFLENDLNLNDLRDFVRFVFEKPRDQWIITYVGWFINEWILDSGKVGKNKNAPGLKAPETGKIEEGRREETQHLHFFGEGFRDNEITREQFWVGLYWRRQHLNKEQREELRRWQYDNLTKDELFRLEGWSKEYDAKVGFDAIKQFYIELARMTSTTVEETLKRTYRLSQRYKYKDDELIMIPE